MAAAAKQCLPPWTLSAFLHQASNNLAQCFNQSSNKWKQTINDFPALKILQSTPSESIVSSNQPTPRFRFLPSEEQLIDYYLPKRIAAKEIDWDVIKDVDLHKIEPWDLIELCKIGVDDENDWYFFSQKVNKYPTGTRTNRATHAGFWKATGRDKAIYSKHGLVGMRKTLVFYEGRAPNGLKSDWIMHEYRLETSENDATQVDGWVVCRVFRKPTPTTTTRKMGDYESPCWNHPNQALFTSKLNSSSQISRLYTSSFHHHCQCNPELKLPCDLPPKSLLQLSQQDSPKLPHGFGRNNGRSLKSSTTTHEEQMDNQNHTQNFNSFYGQRADQMTGWRLMDDYVASQVRNDHDSLKQHNLQAFHEPEYIHIHDPKSKWLENSDESAWTPGSSCQINLRK